VGGLTAINNPGLKVDISAGVNGPVLHEFQLKTFSGLFSALSRQNLLVVGCQFFQDRAEMDGLRPPDSRVFDLSLGWIVHDSSQKWSQIASEAMKVDKMEVADVAARIGFELRAVEHRVLELSKAYSVQLRALAITQKLEDYNRFIDLNTGAVVHSVHALFYELGVLRDYIAEFISRFVLGVQKKNGEPIATMAELKIALSPSENELAKEILAITDRKAKGWLATVSAYRNLFTHVAPMEHVGKRSFAVQEYIQLDSGLRLPVLYHPLPDSALDLVKNKKRQLPFATFLEWANASSGHRPNRADQPDALTFLHDATIRMAQLADRIVGMSPVEPKMAHFGPDDVIGPIRITRS
jgi:hypothetical protein